MKNKMVSLREASHSSLNSCRMYGRESYSDIVDRLVVYYKANYSGDESVKPAFMDNDLNKMNVPHTQESKNSTASCLPEQPVVTSTQLSNDQTRG